MYSIKRKVPEKKHKINVLLVFVTEMKENCKDICSISKYCYVNVNVKQNKRGCKFKTIRFIYKKNKNYRVYLRNEYFNLQ